MAGIVFPRIEERREDLGVTKVRMAEVLGITPRALDKKLNGESEFTAKEIRTISRWWGEATDSLLEKMEEVPA